MSDGLSAQHYRAVWAEIQGRFFSQEEADKLREAIEARVVMDPQIRASAARCWPNEEKT